MVVNLARRDLPQLTKEQEQKLRMLGVDPDALAAQQAAAGGDEEFQAQKRQILEG